MYDKSQVVVFPPSKRFRYRSLLTRFMLVDWVESFAGEADRQQLEAKRDAAETQGYLTRNARDAQGNVALYAYMPGVPEDKQTPPQFAMVDEPEPEPEPIPASDPQTVIEPPTRQPYSSVNHDFVLVNCRTNNFWAGRGMWTDNIKIAKIYQGRSAAEQVCTKFDKRWGYQVAQYMTVGEAKEEFGILE
jgi:hypothetical protein